MSEELKPCPFCGGSWFFQNKRSIGRRSIEGFFECKKCGARVGEGMVVFDGEDAQEKAAKLVNTRHERTCRMTLKSDDCDEIYPVYWYVCSECGKTCEGDENEPCYPICPNCGAKVVG